MVLLLILGNGAVLCIFLVRLAGGVAPIWPWGLAQ
jgi:hypothetical protein